jgi:hypothetical protein
MAKNKQTIKIESVLGGHSPTSHFSASNQYRASLGIDPSQPIDDAGSNVSTIGSGLIRPVASEKFTGTDIKAAPLWMVPNPKDSSVYVTDALGSTYTLDAAFTGATAVFGLDVANAHGNGSAYYDNYIYVASNTDIARYGRLDGSASLDSNYWTGTLSKTALVNTTYPVSFKSKIEYPNHVMHRHSDGKLYIADVVDNQGTLHYVATTKTTNEGDTDNSSTYDKVNVGYGLWPTAIESYGSDLAVAFYEGDTSSLRQPRAKLAFWDTTSANVNKIVWVEYPDQYISALKNVNGILYVVSGNINAQGFRVTRFIGGYTFEEVWYSETGEPCMPGAVDGILNQFLVGNYTNVPESDGCVYAKGLQKNALGGGVFNTMRCTGGNSSTVVTSVLVADNNEFSFLGPVIGWTQAGDGSTSASHGVDKQGTDYGNANSVWWSQVYRIGQRFKINKVRIPLAQAVAANTTLTATIYTDDGSTTTALTTINDTNYPNGERFISIRPDGLTAENNFWIELKWTGSAVMTVSLPIEVDFEVIQE